MSKKTWFYSATAAVTVLSLFLVPWAGAAERQDVSSDSMIEKEIAVYSHWLEDAYGAVAEERALMNDDLEQPTAKEREVIENGEWRIENERNDSSCFSVFHIIIKVHLVAPYDLDFMCNVTT